MKKFIAWIALSFVLTACGSRVVKKLRRIDDDESENSPEIESYYGFHSVGWKTLPIELMVDERFSDRQVRAIESAVSVWNDAVGSELLKIMPTRFTVTKDSSLNGFLADQINSIVLVSDWQCRTSKDEKIMGTTVWEYSNDSAPFDSRFMKNSDIYINNQKYIPDDAILVKTDGVHEVVDLESLTIHELGHLLGLAHADPNGDYSVMTPSLNLNESKTARILSRTDFQRIRYLYVPGSPPPDGLTPFYRTQPLNPNKASGPSSWDRTCP